MQNKAQLHLGALGVFMIWAIITCMFIFVISYAYTNRYVMCAYSVDRYPGGVYVMDTWTGEVRNIRTYPIVVKPQLRKGK